MGLGAAEAIALAWPAAARSGGFVFGQMANDIRRARIQNGLMQESALLPEPCSLQSLVPGCAASDWHGPLAVCGTGAVWSRSDRSGPVDVTIAAAFWAA